MWKAAYLEAHEGVARPMTRQQVMEEAKARGVVFTEENFDKMFRCEKLCCLAAREVVKSYHSLEKILCIDRNDSPNWGLLSC